MLTNCTQRNEKEYCDEAFILENILFSLLLSKKTSNQFANEQLMTKVFNQLGIEKYLNKFFHWKYSKFETIREQLNKNEIRNSELIHSINDFTRKILPKSGLILSSFKRFIII